MDGILLVDKPAGWTSHDVVAKIRNALRQAQSQRLKAKSEDKELLASSFQLSAGGSKIRVGHTGTLDPMATGLLVLVLGSYTKRAAEYSKLDKVYEAELTLGATSSTGDSEGEITPKSAQKASEKAIKDALSTFLGKIMQVPPAYSAIKVDGKRAYKMARAGHEVKIEPRAVTIYEITDVNYDYPKLKFTVKVSSGTYIRSLAEDIGEKLGTGAYLSALRRTQVGQSNLKDALKIKDLTGSEISKTLQK